MLDCIESGDKRSDNNSKSEHFVTGFKRLVNLLLRFAMSQTAQTLPVAPTPSNFPAIFCASMKEYEKKTKKDLLTHPLMALLQACDSPTDILAVLRTQVQQFEESTRDDDKFTKWLNPTVNVLYAFSATLGAGVGLVNSFSTILLRSTI